MMAQEYLSIREVAAMFHVQPKTVRRWVGKGELPSIRIGGTLRIPKDRLDDLLILNETRDRASDSQDYDRWVDNILSELDAVRKQAQRLHPSFEDSVTALAAIRASKDGDDE